MLVLFGSLKLLKIHPFRIVLYIFGPKGLYEKKGTIGVSFTSLLDSLKLKRTELSLSLNSLKANSDKLVLADKTDFHYR